MKGNLLKYYYRNKLRGENIKKIVCIFLVMVMLLALSTTAFLAEDNYLIEQYLIIEWRNCYEKDS